MTFTEAPNNMLIHKSQSIKHFGYDSITDSTYTFNKLGYRSNIEFDIRDDVVIFLGNSFTFGIGLDIEKTFSGIVSKNIKNPVYNFSWGCYGHTNNEQLILLNSILKLIKPKFVFLQINNLDRDRINGEIKYNNNMSTILSNFEKFYSNAQTLLKNINHRFLYWDDRMYDIKISNCLIKNRYCVDNSIPIKENTIGEKSHKLIALKLLHELNTYYFF